MVFELVITIFILVIVSARSEDRMKTVLNFWVVRINRSGHPSCIFSYTRPNAVAGFTRDHYVFLHGNFSPWQLETGFSPDRMSVQIFKRVRHREELRPDDATYQVFPLSRERLHSSPRLGNFNLNGVFSVPTYLWSSVPSEVGTSSCHFKGGCFSRCCRHSWIRESSFHLNRSRIAVTLVRSAMLKLSIWTAVLVLFRFLL